MVGRDDASKGAGPGRELGPVLEVEEAAPSVDSVAIELTLICRQGKARQGATVEWCRCRDAGKESEMACQCLEVRPKPLLLLWA